MVSACTTSVFQENVSFVHHNSHYSSTSNNVFFDRCGEERIVNQFDHLRIVPSSTATEVAESLTADPAESSVPESTSERSPDPVDANNQDECAKIIPSSLKLTPEFLTTFQTTKAFQRSTSPSKKNPFEQEALESFARSLSTAAGMESTTASSKYAQKPQSKCVTAIPMQPNDKSLDELSSQLQQRLSLQALSNAHLTLSLPIQSNADTAAAFTGPNGTVDSTETVVRSHTRGQSSQLAFANNLAFGTFLSTGSNLDQK